MGVEFFQQEAFLEKRANPEKESEHKVEKPFDPDLLMDPERFVEASASALLTEFPNPGRKGCPGRDVVEKIASRRLSLKEAEAYLPHMTSCSPCRKDYVEFVEQYVARRKRVMWAVAASVLLVAVLGTWGLLWWSGQTGQSDLAVLDLRDRSRPRGTETQPTVPPLVITRRTSRMDIYLPLGTPGGTYNVRIVTASGGPIFDAKANATLRGGVRLLEVGVNLSSASAGTYLLEIESAEFPATEYELTVR